jgi:glycosyltransferase involved in cell wall biosynthesis
MSLLLSLFVAVVAIQCSYYTVFSLSFFLKKNNNIPFEDAEANLPISMIVCAKNEALHLKKLLPALLEQKYDGALEFILVDDGSNDDTNTIFNTYSKKDARIKVITLSNEKNKKSSKKKAFTKGISEASHEHVLCTDADCIPMSKKWVNFMSACFADNKSIVLGYGAYEKIDNSFLNKLIRYETVLTAMQYCSYASLGYAYMGVGRNLAYAKEMFVKVDGFSSHAAIASGDDDLFINEVSTKTNTAICLHSDSFTVSKAKTTFKTWIQQKRRHISTASHYKKGHKFLLGLFFLSQIVFPILALYLLLNGEVVSQVILLVCLRYTAFMWALYRWGNLLKEKDLVFMGPLTEISLIFMQCYIFFKNKTSRSQGW